MIEESVDAEEEEGIMDHGCCEGVCEREGELGHCECEAEEFLNKKESRGCSAGWREGDGEGRGSVPVGLLPRYMNLVLKPSVLREVGRASGGSAASAHSEEELQVSSIGFSFFMKTIVTIGAFELILDAAHHTSIRITPKSRRNRDWHACRRTGHDRHLRLRVDDQRYALYIPPSPFSLYHNISSLTITHETHGLNKSSSPSSPYIAPAESPDTEGEPKHTTLGRLADYVSGFRGREDCLVFHGGYIVAKVPMGFVRTCNCVLNIQL
ncbi:hypothetical protein BT69DRAFT_720233 [Atractiella rhizophila]|nr:hypothetical protein BT69DRAFT_720233 [Atractiella rhizophila]